MKNRIIWTLITVTIAAYILVGNIMTFNIGERFPIRLSEVVSAITLIVLLFENRNIRSVGQAKLFRLTYLWLFFGTILAIIFSFMNSISLTDVFISFSYVIRILLILFTIEQIYAYIKKRRISNLLVLKMINSMFILTCIIGVVQYFLFPVVADFYSIFWSFGVYWIPDPHISRAVSTYLDPNYFASILVLGVCVNVYIMSLSNRKIKYIIYILIYVLTILLTKSRSGLLGLIIAVLVYVIFTFYKKITMTKLISGLSIIIVALLVFMFSNIEVIVRVRTFMTDPSAQARFNSWAKGIEIFLKNPFGIGFNMIGAYNDLVGGGASQTTGYGNDSSLIVVLVTTGIIGSIIYIGMVINFLVSRHNHLLLKSMLISSIVISNFNNLLFYVLWLFPFYFLSLLIERNNMGAPVQFPKDSWSDSDLEKPSKVPPTNNANWQFL